jgi:predicted nucleic acid-binding protein
MTTSLIDSCVYISAFLSDDPNHLSGVDLLEKCHDKILIPYIIFSEVLTVLTYKHSKKPAEAFSDYVLNDSRFIIIDNAVIEELLFWQSIPAQLSFADIVLLYLTQKYDAKLFTFDAELNKWFKKLYNP